MVDGQQNVRNIGTSPVLSGSFEYVFVRQVISQYHKAPEFASLDSLRRCTVRIKEHAQAALEKGV
jgi:hypothetical protein